MKLECRERVDLEELEPLFSSFLPPLGVLIHS